MPILAFESAPCAGGLGWGRIVLSLALLGSLTWPGAVVSADRPALTIKVWNRARVSSSILQSALAIDRQTFEQAGVDTGWLIDSFEPNPRADLAVDILRTRPPLLLTQDDTLGFVWWNRQGYSLPWADIFFRNIIEQATTRTETTLLLANVIAHELVHLLLGPKHSDSGLMQAHWATRRLLSAPLRLPLRIERGDAVQLRLAAARIAGGEALSAAEDTLEAPR